VGITLKSVTSKLKSTASKVKSATKSFVASQPSRLANVKAVIAAPFTGGKVQANTGSNLVNKVLSSAANHPLATAAIGGTAANIPKAISLAKSSLAKRAGSKIANSAVGKAASKTGLIDLSELGKPAAANAPVSPGGGLLTKTSETGGLLTTPVSRASSVSKPRRKSPRSKKKKTSTRKKTRRTSKRSKRSKRRGYGSQKAYNRPGGKKVYKTKTGQPYILLASGKARFIKRSK